MATSREERNRQQLRIHFVSILIRTSRRDASHMFAHGSARRHDRVQPTPAPHGAFDLIGARQPSLPMQEKSAEFVSITIPQRLSHSFKKPKLIAFVDDFPRTPAG